MSDVVDECVYVSATFLSRLKLLPLRARVFVLPKIYLIHPNSSHPTHTHSHTHTRARAYARIVLPELR